MFGITVFNRDEAWKLLVLGLGIDKYYRTGMYGDECWVLYLKPINAVDSEDVEIKSKIISTRFRQISSDFVTGWAVYS